MLPRRQSSRYRAYLRHGALTVTLPFENLISSSFKFIIYLFPATRTTTSASDSLYDFGAILISMYVYVCMYVCNRSKVIYTGQRGLAGSIQPLTPHPYGYSSILFNSFHSLRSTTSSLLSCLKLLPRFHETTHNFWVMLFTNRQTDRRANGAQRIVPAILWRRCSTDNVITSAKRGRYAMFDVCVSLCQNGISQKVVRGLSRNLPEWFHFGACLSTPYLSPSLIHPFLVYRNV